MALTHLLDTSVLTRLREPAAAEARDLAVMHHDAGFDRIAAVAWQSCEWVAPAGSVD